MIVEKLAIFSRFFMLALANATNWAQNKKV
jgi:hypothetical protein